MTSFRIISRALGAPADDAAPANGAADDAAGTSPNDDDDDDMARTDTAGDAPAVQWRKNGAAGAGRA